MSLTAVCLQLPGDKVLIMICNGATVNTHKEEEIWQENGAIEPPPPNFPVKGRRPVNASD